MTNPIKIIIAREYFERVKRKSFIITTILMPIFMLAMMAAPTLIMMMSEPEARNIAVIDDSGIVAGKLQSSEEVKFTSVSDNFEAIKASEDYDAILCIGKQVLTLPSDNVSLYTYGAPSMQTEMFITSQIKDILEDQRIRNYNIDNLAQILEEVSVDLTMSTYRIDQDEESATSSTLSYLLGIFTMFILYMFIMLYGNMVMNSIIEEKNNRVLEIVVSSVKPTHLMLGKIVGIGCVAITQILIWAVILLACSIWLMPSMVTLASASGDTGIIQAMSQLSDVGFIANLLVFMILFLIGGYLFYSAIYAAIGSAVDNIQDASQLQTITIVPIMLAMLISMSVVNDPNSALSVWTSIIPFTSPMVMMARVPFGIPVWQSIVSVVVLYISFLAMIWVAAKVYRVGIFMYGKKPTYSDLIRWIRYK